MPLRDYVENIKGHNPSPFNALQLGSFTYREIAIKSPICIPGYVIRKVGMPDERFAPWDDIAYCYTVSMAGFDNGVYAIDFASDLAWGTTRQKKQNNDIGAVHRKNLTLFKDMYLDEAVTRKKRPVYSHKTYKIFEPADPPRLTFKQKVSGARVHLERVAKYYLKLMLKK
jgi:GT2 family glycosyltransferase